MANFDASPSGGVKPLDVQFADHSTGNITGWQWTFGDGGTSTNQNPQHTYTATGSYTVSLKVSGPGGGDTMTRTAYIHVTQTAVKPAANFDATPNGGVAPVNVQFNDRSSGDVTTWEWEFGDGATSAERNPQHTYAAVGSYTVRLTVTGPAGSDAMTRTAYINVTPAPVPPVASFTAISTTGTAPFSVQFADHSSGTIDTWTWTFGDGATSNERNPQHVYDTEGTYTVQLTVSGAGGDDTMTRKTYIQVTEPAPAETPKALYLPHIQQ